MHYRGNPPDEQAKITHLRSKVPEKMWKNANKMGNLDGLPLAMEICEVLDREYEPDFDEAMNKAKKKKKKKKKHDIDRRRKRDTDDIEDSGNHSKKSRRRHCDRDADSVDEFPSADDNNSEIDGPSEEEDSSADDGSSGDDGSSKEDDDSGDDGSSSDDDGSSADDESIEENDRSYDSETAPSDGNSTVVLRTGWTGRWKNCNVNPESAEFSRDNAKTYFFNRGGKQTWYREIFLKENARRKAERCAEPHYQSPYPRSPNVPHAYHYGVPPTSSNAPPQQNNQSYHFQGGPYSAP